jgi:hypothetical protein
MLSTGRFRARGGAMRGAVLVAIAAAAACTLAARDHACYPYLAKQYQGHVPKELVHRLARERGTRRWVEPDMAPEGYYWRPFKPEKRDPQAAVVVLRGYELARCPGTLPAPGEFIPALPSDR